MEENKSQLLSIPGDNSKSASSLPNLSPREDGSKIFAREASSVAYAVPSTSTVNALSESPTALNPAPSPKTSLTAGQEISTTTQSRPKMPSGVPATAAAANSAISSRPESSRSPSRAFLETPTSSLLPFPSLKYSPTFPFSFAIPSVGLPNKSSPAKIPVSGSQSAESSTSGPSIFSTRAPVAPVQRTQVHTFGTPSVKAAAIPGSIAGPTVFGRPSGLLATPGSTAERISSSSSSLSGAPPAAVSVPPTSAAAASNGRSNAPPGLSFQTPPAPTPATAETISTTPSSLSETPAVVPTLSTSAVSASSKPRNAPPGSPSRMPLAPIPAAPFNSNTKTGSVTPNASSPPDSRASILVKQLQAQIPPLKQKTLLEGLLSHVILPDIDSFKDHNEQNKCHICLSPFLTGSIPELPIKLPCGHICGSVCILKWLAPQQARPREKSCPVCRKPIYGFECASEWNALSSLEKDMEAVAGKLQAMATAPGEIPTQSLSSAPAVTQPIEADIPATWGKGLFLQKGVGHEEMQWEAWTHFLEELVAYVESAEAWALWYSRRRLVVPIINMITVHEFINMKEKGNVWISRVIEEVPELYLPLHSLLDRAHPDYYLAVPGEEHYRRAADLHARIEARGRCLWKHCSRPSCSEI